MSANRKKQQGSKLPKKKQQQGSKPWQSSNARAGGQVAPKPAINGGHPNKIRGLPPNNGAVPNNEVKFYS